MLRLLYILTIKVNIISRVYLRTAHTAAGIKGNEIKNLVI